MAELAPYQRDFVALLVEAGALTFGDFVTKSGRRTPYFVNIGNICTGPHVSRLGEFYARAIHEHLGAEFDNLFGPAYKGIPLCTIAAAKLFELFGLDVSYTFNRKEVKDHGEGGALVGHRYAEGDRVVIVEDVTTAGTSVYESVPLLTAAGAQLAGVVVAVDRRERGQGARTALVEIAERFGVPTFAIVTVDEVVGYLHGRELNGRVLVDDAMLGRIREYRAAYGAA